jgi:hypothetical protein
LCPCLASSIPPSLLSQAQDVQGHYRDRGKIDELYAPDWQAWFPKGDDRRHGTKDDPRMVLIGVEVHAAAFLEVNKPQPVVLFELVKGWLTGSTPELGEMHHVCPSLDTDV